TLPLPELVAMLEAGVHFGHERSKKNPKMETFVFQQRNRVAIIDLEQTQQALQKALAYVYQLASLPAKEILFVGTKRQAREIVRRHAESAGMPFVTKRWLGGTLTNFSTILKSIEKLEELKSVEGTPAAEKMTKKELSVMRKEINRLEAVLEGIRAMRALPHAIFVVGSHDEKLAVLEAKRVGIPVIGICDTNADPDLVDYAIPANDDAVRALDLVVGAVAATIIQARGAIVPPVAATPAA
ncbi:MAG TPA: 30S ribosomal protein S2, partial [Methylophilaceae bacterium]|nr:30S ribosomal protein S2 [Methylophilaceae bacterium]